MKRFLSIAMLPLLLQACFVEGVDNNPVDFPDGPTEGYMPIYADQAMSQINVQGPEQVADPGKIYIYQDLVFLNERSRGLHIIRRNVDGSMERIAFVNIPGNTDLAVREGKLYANYDNNLATFSLLNPEEPVLEDILVDAFDPTFNDVPPAEGVFFLCPDEGREVVAWEKTTINSPRCYVP